MVYNGCELHKHRGGDPEICRLFEFDQLSERLVIDPHEHRKFFHQQLQPVEGS